MAHKWCIQHNNTCTDKFSYKCQSKQTESQHAEHQDPETSSTKWNAVGFNVINYSCVFPAMTCSF